MVGLVFNIYLDNTFKIRISDFGLAQISVPVKLMLALFLLVVGNRWIHISSQKQSDNGNYYYVGVYSIEL